MTQGIEWNLCIDSCHTPSAFETQARALQIFEEWKEKGQSRTLGFCVSIHHADFMASFFTGKGVKAVSVHSKSMVRRHDALDRLSNGLLQVIFCVDLFNEGLKAAAGSFGLDTGLPLSVERADWVLSVPRGLPWADLETGEPCWFKAAEFLTLTRNLHSQSNAIAAQKKRTLKQDGGTHKPES
ncbi:MAG: hypothetical protein RBQ72_02340 [Desulfobacterium sp.]|nr:hypothetical protein [Desulfobacterium sp.]